MYAKRESSRGVGRGGRIGTGGWGVCMGGGGGKGVVGSGGGKEGDEAVGSVHSVFMATDHQHLYLSVYALCAE